MQINPPFALLAELTHRCPLRCAYCSNPLELERASSELATEDWADVFTQAADMGCLQVHLSGGEPAVRKDLVALVKAADDAGLYSNLITSGLLLDEAKLDALHEAGLSHIQLSVQDVEEAPADMMAGYDGAFCQKKIFAGWVKARGFALTINTVLTRHNMHRLPAVLEQAYAMGAERVELASAQYYGWGLKNRAGLMPTREAVYRADAQVEQARKEYEGRMVIDWVVPDYYADRPKACMGGWANRFFTVTPSGKMLPCHAAETIPGLEFLNVKDVPLADIWHGSAAFNAYRGTDWMPELCRTCDRAEIDFGGCRCQALALAGDAAATDPACAKSPHHDLMATLAEQEAEADAPDLIYRRFTV